MPSIMSGANLRAGGDDQEVVGDGLAVLDFDPLRFRVDRLDRGLVPGDALAERCTPLANDALLGFVAERQKQETGW